MKTTFLSFGLIFLGLASPVSATGQALGGDGTAPASVSTPTKPGLLCQAGTDGCPRFPRALTVDRETLIHRLEDLTGCSEHVGDAQSIINAGQPEAVVQALSHLVVAEAGLSLHAKKMAVELIATNHSENSVAALEAIFARSTQIVGPVVAKRNLAEQEQQAKVRAQAEELRRIVVLAAGRQKGAERLLARAALDAGRSVALTAQRLRAR